MRVQLAVLAAVLALSAGCVGSPGDEATVPGSPGADETPDHDRPWPNRTVEWPDGPKQRPAWPPDPDAASVGAFVRDHEYGYVYNSLWFGEHTDVRASCEEPEVAERGGGWVVEVTCTGYSNSDVPTDSTATPGPHADWFTRTYRYRVDEDTILRDRVESSG